MSRGLPISHASSRTKTLIAALAFATLAVAPAARAQEAFGDLTLSFPGLQARTGQVMIAVYDSAQAWAAGL